MKLKLDENGNVVVKDGKPVYEKVDADGKIEEIAFDAPGAMSKIAALNGEAKDHRLAKEDALSKLEKFKDIDPEKALAALASVKNFEGIDIEAAKKALETVKNLDDSKLIEAGKVDTIKADLQKEFDKEFGKLKEQHETQLGDANKNLEAQADTIRQLLIKSKFNISPQFTSVNGKPSVTTMPPEVAAKYFGDNFKVEGEGADARLVGYINGEKILSRKESSLGQPAGFEESIAMIIDASELKDSITRATSGGPGADGNNNTDHGNGFVFLSKTDAQDINKYKAAKQKADETGATLKVE